jgi:hypothetical protein
MRFTIPNAVLKKPAWPIDIERRLTMTGKKVGSNVG